MLREYAGKISDKVVGFKTPYNSKGVYQVEVNELPSLTVPDMAMTVKEILIRHSQGLPFEAGKVPIFDDAQDFDDYLPNLALLDISERQELLERSTAYMKKHQQQQQRLRKDKEEKLLQEKVRKELETRKQSTPLSGGASGSAVADPL